MSTPPYQTPHAKAEPLSFLAGRDPRANSDALLTDTDALAWLEYDEAQKAAWPDLRAHGLQLMIVALPTGALVDLVKFDGDRASQPALSGLRDLGFEPYPRGGMWLRPHRPVHAEDFVKRFPKTIETTLPHREIIRVPSREAKRQHEEARLADRKRFHDLKFATVGRFDAEKNFGWVEITTSEQAKYAAEISKTSIAVHFEAERKANEGRPAPHRWFMFVNAATRPVTLGDLIVATPGPGARLRNAVLHVAGTYCVARGDTNPHPHWAEKIEKLAAEIATPIPPNQGGKLAAPGDGELAYVGGLVEYLTDFDVTFVDLQRIQRPKPDQARWMSCRTRCPTGDRIEVLVGLTPPASDAITVKRPGKPDMKIEVSRSDSDFRIRLEDQTSRSEPLSSIPALRGFFSRLRAMELEIPVGTKRFVLPAQTPSAIAYDRAGHTQLKA